MGDTCMVHACYVGDTWHDACMPCEFVWSIKTGSIEEKRGKKGKKRRRKRERNKGLLRRILSNSGIAGIFMNFGVKRNLNWWVTHGMVHAMWVTHGMMHACHVDLSDL